MTSESLPPIFIDSREPLAHPWIPYFTVPVIHGKNEPKGGATSSLRTGDVTLPGCGDYVAVERKALGDMISCLSWNRDRFEAELLRSTRINDFIVICEGSYSDLRNGRYRSNMSAASAWASVFALQQRFRVPFVFAGSVRIAAEYCEAYLMRWYREHQKVIESVNRAIKQLNKQET